MKANKAQTLAEYVLLIAIVVAAIAGMQVYVKRGLQARYKAISDCTGESVGIEQYEPYYAQSEQTIEQEHNTTYTYINKKLSREIDSTINREDASIVTGLDVNADDEWF